MKGLRFVPAFALLWVSATAATAQRTLIGSASAVERLIRDEMATLNGVVGFTTPVFFSDVEPTSAVPDTGIVINRVQIESIRRTAGVRQFREFLRLLLAHEVAHHVQFRAYSAAIRRLPEEERRVYEAQADILAGKHFTEMLPPTSNVNVSEAIDDALQVAFDLGTTEYSLGTHPTHESRLVATRFGMSAGMMTNLARTMDPRAPGSVALIALKIDTRPGESTLLWSFRQAKRITSYRNQAAVNLVLTGKQEEWNWNGNPPIVRFSLTYENVGMRPLLVDVMVESAAVPRNAPDSTMGWMLWSAHHESFRIEPGATRTISGVLEWYGDNEYMPLLDYPPSRTAVASVEFADEQFAGDPRHAPVALMPAAPTIVETLQFRAALQRLIVHTANRTLAAVRSGPGRRIVSDVTKYPSSIRLPGARDITLRFSANKGAGVSATFLTSRSRTAAEAAFSRLISHTAQALSEWESERRDRSDSGELYRSVRYRRDGMQAVVRVVLLEVDGEYYVDLDVEEASGQT